jgi:hypothetical protein
MMGTRIFVLYHVLVFTPAIFGQDIPSFYEVFEKSIMTEGEFPKLEFEDGRFARLKREEKDQSKENADFDYAERYRAFVEEHFRDRDDKRKKDDIKADKDYEYRFDYEPSTDYERIKSMSEKQAQELKKNGDGNCKSVKKGDSICQVCEDPNTGSKSESCAFASEPHHKKYAFSNERNYNSKDDEPESQEECENGGDSAGDEATDEDTEYVGYIKKGPFVNQVARFSAF